MSNVRWRSRNFTILQNDVSETTDVAAQNPEIVKRLEAARRAGARRDLGDTLTNRQGAGVREPGSGCRKTGRVKPRRSVACRERCGE